MGKEGREMLNLNGTDWTIQGFGLGEGIKKKAYNLKSSKKSSIPATVPGNIQLDLFKDKHPDRDIYYATGVEEVQWAEQKEWWYRKEFIIPECWKQKQVFLTSG